MAKKDMPSVVVPLFGQAPKLPELQVDVVRPLSRMAVGPVSPIDLTEKPKVIVAQGNGGSGKTTLERWMVERALHRGDGTGLVLATIDSVNRELRHYFRETVAPDGEDPVRWLEWLFEHLATTKQSATIDFGGNDTSLRSLAQEADIVGSLREDGIETVALYTFTPRETDINPLAAMEAAGFKPEATALILNLGRADPDRDPTEEFAQLRRHSVYQAALDRGAVEIWMPRLSVAKAVEDRRITFTEARTGQGSSPLGRFDRSKISRWLEAMDGAFLPIARWLP